MLEVVSWNVNSLRVRLDLVLRYLDIHWPEVLCLQETKVGEASFPREAFAKAGYELAVAGPGGYAGVAIASRLPIEEQIVGLDGFAEDKAPGRRLAVRIGDTWVDTVYVPTRTAIGKIEFLEALRVDHERRFGEATDLVLAGDFNLCFDERDYASPRLISEPDVHPGRPEDLAFRALLGSRLVDCFRARHEDGGHFTWFPLAEWAIHRNYGMRLDYVFATAGLVDRLVEVVHEGEPRSWPRPSDHLPVRARFA